MRSSNLSALPSDSPSDRPTTILVVPNPIDDSSDEKIHASDGDDDDGVRVANIALIGGMAAIVTLVMAGLLYQYRINQVEAAEEQ
jgi:hypothetical protein